MVALMLSVYVHGRNQTTLTALDYITFVTLIRIN